MFTYERVSVRHMFVSRKLTIGQVVSHSADAAASFHVDDGKNQTNAGLRAFLQASDRNNRTYPNANRGLRNQSFVTEKNKRVNAKVPTFDTSNLIGDSGVQLQTGSNLPMLS